uniref:Lysosome-associated membrane glycoprotein 5 n=1 Tax=Meleagris gallopavo TaxID=9103 RepID=A0A803YAZ3_MELGA
MGSSFILALSCPEETKELAVIRLLSFFRMPTRTYRYSFTFFSQEVENLSGLSPNPERDIFVVRENRTTCLMAEFAAKFIVPYDVWASNYVDLITEQADIPLSRGAEMKGKCGTNESELEISWLERAYTLKLFFLKEGHNTSRGPEAFWRLSRIQFAYDTSERTYFKDAVSPGKHTASSHRLSALVTPAGKSYECQAQQTISLISSDHQKSVQLLLSEVRIQPFDITADFVFSEGKAWDENVSCVSVALYFLEESGSHLYHNAISSLGWVVCDPCRDFNFYEFSSAVWSLHKLSLHEH